MLRYKTETRPGLVALYDIQSGNGVGQFLQPRSLHGATFQDLIQRVEVLVFLTQSMLPSWHIVTQHCTNYCVILHLTYLLQQMKMCCKCQNYSPSSREIIKNLSHQLFTFPRLSRTLARFQDFPGLENMTFKFQDFQDV